MEYGYIRVSTREQNEDRQVIALTEWGVDVKRIYLDKQSGKDFERPQYRRLLRKLKSGDALIVKASTAWDETMTKSWSSGVSSPRRSTRTLLCWTCRCWTREPTAI